MMPAMYSAISGLEAHQTMLNVTANNLANVDTIGFKGDSTTFDSELSELLSGGTGETASNAGTNPEQVGLGVEVGSIEQEMSAGSLESTGNTLDVAIQGNGFLVVGNSASPVTAPTGYVPGTTTATAINGTSTDGTALPTSLEYTQAGNLTTNAEGFLTTQAGQYVVGYTEPNDGTSTAPSADSTATYLYIPPGSSNVSIGSSGEVTYTDEDESDSTYGDTCVAGYVALASFSNESGLTTDAGTEWTQSANSGAATFGTADSGTFANSELISGELEQSNVDMASEFTNMIEAERGYQANSTVISTADTMMQTLIQMAQS